jgi:GT2 family glycosyltransferase
MSRPLVSLITVNLNGRAHLDHFLQSVLAQDYSHDSLEVIVVDNGSADGSVDFLRAEHPEVRVLANDENVGFARANNQAAETARGHYLALLNNDMRLEPSWVRRMVACLEEAPSDVVCAGSLILNWDGSLIDFGGATLAFNGIGFQKHAQTPLDTGRLARPEAMLFACGGALMVERDVYLETGGFDEDYFAYLEDVDFGWRLWVLGFRVFFCPEAVVYHRHNATSSQFDSYRKAVLIERNALYSVIKNYNDASLSAVLAPSLLLAFKRMAVGSGIPREEFSFTPRVPWRGQAPPTRLLQTDESYLQAFLRVWRHEGSRVALRKSASKGSELFGRKARELLRSGGQTITVAHRDDTRLIQRESYATVVAVEDLIDHLPRLLEKRRRIQAARRRPDAEIFHVFGTPLKAPEQSPRRRREYESAHEATLRALGVAKYFESPTGRGEDETALGPQHDPRTLT